MTRPPEMWLVGCTQALEKRGMSPYEALREALRLWAEQEQCAADYKADRLADR